MIAAVPKPKTDAASTSGHGVWRIAVLLLLIAGFGLTVLAFYPGYITVDAQYVYAEAQTWHFGDWQSPAMAVLWRFIDPLAPGSASMFLFTAILYWGSFALLALLALRSSKWLGLLVPFLALVPPAFVFLGMIWRDVQFAVIWLCASALAFAAACMIRRRGLLRGLALALIGFGVLLRPNAALAAPLLATCAVWPGPFMLRRTLVVFVPLSAFFVALVPIVYYGLLDAEQQHPLHSILVFDLGGIPHFTGENQFPVSWSPGGMQLRLIPSPISPTEPLSCVSFSCARTWRCPCGIGTSPTPLMAGALISRPCSGCTTRCSPRSCSGPPHGSSPRPRFASYLFRGEESLQAASAWHSPPAPFCTF
jgi:hypothetical protein